MRQAGCRGINVTIEDLDERLRDIETQVAVGAQQLRDHTEQDMTQFDRLNERFDSLDENLDEVRLYLAERKGEEKAAAKTGALSGGIVSAAFFGIAQGIRSWFGSS